MSILASHAYEWSSVCLQEKSERGELDFGLQDGKWLLIPSLLTLIVLALQKSCCLCSAIYCRFLR